MCLNLLKITNISNLKDIIPGTKVKYNKRHISNDISFLGLDVRSRSHTLRQGQRHGGVCVLWMLLVSFLFQVNQEDALT